MDHKFSSGLVYSDGPLESMEAYFERGWTDGLPVVPPSRERVSEFLDFTGLDPGKVIGTIPTREVVVTVEKVAINAVMAGCLPEYMPTVLAAASAILEEPFNLHANSGTLSGAAQIVLLNGAVRRELEVNCKDGVFGPGFRPNATIGRAIRLLIRNVARSIPGFLDRSSFSQPGRYSWCFGENEEESPWIPLNVEKGYPLDSSVVTVFAVMDPVKVSSLSPKSPELWLDRAVTQVRMVWTYQAESSFDDLRSLLVVVGFEDMHMAAEAGWNKSDIRGYLFKKLRMPSKGYEFEAPIFKESNILIVAAGGRAMHQTWFMVPFPSHGPVTKVIESYRR